jgi:hypothetical protein
MVNQAIKIPSRYRENNRIGSVFVCIFGMRIQILHEQSNAVFSQQIVHKVIQKR